jgi:hypothetical protein
LEIVIGDNQMKSKLSILIFVLSLTVVSVVAQTSNWENLKKLPTNAILVAETKNGKTVKGFFVSATDSEITINDKNGETKLDKLSIKRIYDGIEKHKVPLFARIAVGIVTFIVIDVAVISALDPNQSSGEPNSVDMLGLVAGTTGTVGVVKLLRKPKRIKKRDLIYQE